jgi:polysaccharide deacetylase family protein (PEP-CTERM system associated)
MEKPVRILTFDIEEWFHLLDIETVGTVDKWDNFETRIHKNTERILQLLKECNQKATFFCLGWIAEKYPQIIADISRAGYEIGSHTSYHQLAYKLTPSKFREDLQRSIEKLECITGKKVRSFRVPGFSITRKNLWAFEIIAQCGIQIDSSVFPAPRNHGGYKEFDSTRPCIINTPCGEIKEFPINTISFLGKRIVFSGGGYFRVFPYSLIHWFISHSEYVMSYFHPRDFDPDQPLLQGLPLSRRFKSYTGLKSAFSKLKKLLNNFYFTDIDGAISLIKWEQKQLVQSR